MNKQTLKKQLVDFINEMDESELISLHNEYGDSVNHWDDRIYSMWDFDEIMSGTEPFEVARMCFYGDFNPNDDYFHFNGYGNLESLDGYELTDHIYIDDIADYIIRNDDELYNDDIRTILDEFNEVNEEV